MWSFWFEVNEGLWTRKFLTLTFSKILKIKEFNYFQWKSQKIIFDVRKIKSFLLVSKVGKCFCKNWSFHFMIHLRQVEFRLWAHQWIKWMLRGISRYAASWLIALIWDKLFFGLQKVKYFKLYTCWEADGPFTNEKSIVGLSLSWSYRRWAVSPE